MFVDVVLNKVIFIRFEYELTTELVQHFILFWIFAFLVFVVIFAATFKNEVNLIYFE
jgi:hypothetical protein